MSQREVFVPKGPVGHDGTGRPNVDVDILELPVDADILELPADRTVAMSPPASSDTVIHAPLQGFSDQLGKLRDESADDC